MFDETNGSQMEQVNPHVVGLENLPCEAIKQMAICDVRPVKEEKEKKMKKPKKKKDNKSQL